MKVNQRDVVELSFEVAPNTYKPHPAIVISTQEVFDTEGYFFCVMMSTKNFNDYFVFELTEEMFVNPASRPSYVKCQMIDIFTPEEVMKRTGSIKKDAFRELMTKINETVFGLEIE